jgi:hypothetical protein
MQSHAGFIDRDSTTLAKRGAVVVLVLLAAFIIQVFLRNKPEGKIVPDKGWYEYGAMKAKGRDFFGYADGSPAPPPPGWKPSSTRTPNSLQPMNPDSTP